MAVLIGHGEDEIDFVDLPGDGVLLIVLLLAGCRLLSGRGLLCSRRHVGRLGSGRRLGRRGLGESRCGEKRERQEGSSAKDR